ncbi:MAG TPA: hypothetical protein VGR29_05520 [Thermomicrobiales bacterium]|nr:hypothetical protein [Thermomicrobiales bacterium]
MSAAWLRNHGEGETVPLLHAFIEGRDRTREPGGVRLVPFAGSAFSGTATNSCTPGDVTGKGMGYVRTREIRLARADNLDLEDGSL